MLFKPFDKIDFRQMSLAGMNEEDRTLVWKARQQRSPQPKEESNSKDDMLEIPILDLPTPPTPHAPDNKFTYMEESMHGGFGRLERRVSRGNSRSNIRKLWISLGLGT